MDLNHRNAYSWKIVRANQYSVYLKFEKSSFCYRGKSITASDLFERIYCISICCILIELCFWLVLSVRNAELILRSEMLLPNNVHTGIKQITIRCSCLNHKSTNCWTISTAQIPDICNSCIEFACAYALHTHFCDSFNIIIIIIADGVEMNFPSTSCVSIPIDCAL